MKHSKKKFTYEKSLGSNVGETILNAATTLPPNTSQNLEEDYIATVITDDHRMIGCFKVAHEGRNYFIPEPDPIVLYFETARGLSKDITQYKQNLISSLGLVEVSLEKSYDYFSRAMASTLFMFNCLEAFVNSLIPLDYKYSKKMPQKTEVYTRDQILREISFEVKMKTIIPIVTNKNFHVDFGHKFETIKNLKQLRDNIVHTKSHPKGKHIQYNHLYALALDFKYSAAIEHIKDYINYHDPNRIEECLCGKED